MILNATRLEVDTFFQVKSHHYYSNCLIKVSHDASSLRVINSAPFLIKARSYNRGIMRRDRSRGELPSGARATDFWENKVFEVVGIKSTCSTRVANFLNLTNDAITNVFDLSA